MAVCRVFWWHNVGSNFIFCKFDPSYWFFEQVRSNDEWKVEFLSKNFSEFGANLLHKRPPRLRIASGRCCRLSSNLTARSVILTSLLLYETYDNSLWFYFLRIESILTVRSIYKNKGCLVSRQKYRFYLIRFGEGSKLKKINQTLIII